MKRSIARAMGKRITILTAAIAVLLLGACNRGPGEKPGLNLTYEFTIRGSSFEVEDVEDVGAEDVYSSAATIEFEVKELTPELIDKGLISAYLSAPGEDEWVPLPLSLPFRAGEDTITLVFTYLFGPKTVSFVVLADLPAVAITEALSEMDGWRLRVVIDPA